MESFNNSDLTLVYQKRLLIFQRSNSQSLAPPPLGIYSTSYGYMIVSSVYQYNSTINDITLWLLYYLPDITMFFELHHLFSSYSKFPSDVRSSFSLPVWHFVFLYICNIVPQLWPHALSIFHGTCKLFHGNLMANELLVRIRTLTNSHNKSE